MEVFEVVFTTMFWLFGFGVAMCAIAAFVGFVMGD